VGSNFPDLVFQLRMSIIKESNDSYCLATANVCEMLEIKKMPTIPEQLFESLNSAAAIRALIGKTEDLHLDCKVWPKEEDVQKVIAKAACGFANGDGGVIVFGLVAKAGREKDEPDQIQSAEPIGDTGKVKPRIQDLIGQMVEPGIAGIRVAEINEPAGTKSGFVTVLVPATDGLPCRSRKDWKFYQRISSGTYPMEYFQIADMFGKRKRPILDLFIEERIISKEGGLSREFDIGITNLGRAVAKYPGLRFRHFKDRTFTTGYQGNFALPLRQTDKDWIIFGGGVDDIIYPGATIKIATLQQGSHEENFPIPRRVLPKWAIIVELSAEEAETRTVERSFAEKYKM
jgi:hypothetical protein